MPPSDLKGAQKSRGLMAGLGRLAFCALLAAASGCGRPAPAPSADRPPENFERRLTLILERPDFRPAAGALVEIKGETPLISPAGGRGRADAEGRLELVFAPRPQAAESPLKGGDVIVEYPVRAELLIGGRQARLLDERETFARYADPVYQGLNRDPDPGPAYYAITLP